MKEGIVYCSATSSRLRVMRDGKNIIRREKIPKPVVLVEATFEDIRAALSALTFPRTFIQTPFAAPWTPSRPSSASPSSMPPQ